MCLGGGHPKSVALILPQEYSVASNNLAYIQGRLLLLCTKPSMPHLHRHGSIRTLPSCPPSQKPILNLYTCTVLCVSEYWDYLLVWVVKPVVLFKEIGCSFSLACIFTPVGAKALESAPARFKACFSD